MKSPIHDERVIRDDSWENSNRAADYYVECVAFLDWFLDNHPKLASSDVRKKIPELLSWLCADPSRRNAACAEDVAIDLMLFGMIGKALFFLQSQCSPQFCEELRRLFTDINQLRSNTWLFHVAGQLAKAGFAITFLKERSKEGKQTPDFMAKSGSITAYFEANARSQQHTTIDKISSLLWDVMHGDKSAGKHLKFQEAEFDPGVIVVDVSSCNVHANALGLPPYLKLRVDAITRTSSNSYIYDVTRDPEFYGQIANQGNIVDYAIRYFQKIDKSKYRVRALLVGTTMKIVRQEGTISSPKGAFMIVDAGYPQLAIQELAPAIYLVDGVETENLRSLAPDSK